MISIKKADEKDCSLINQLAAQVWKPTYGHILSEEQLDYMFDWMYSVSSLNEQMKIGHTYYILYENETPCGYLSIENEDEHLFHLQKIYVIPSAQGKGFGKCLIEAAENHVRNYGGSSETYIELNVNRNNKAVRFYEKLGFTVDREVDNDIGNGFFMNDYIMKKRVI